MAAMGEMGDVNETLRSVADQAREAWDRFAEQVELERRLRENPMAVLGVAAAAGFVARRRALAGRPAVRAARRRGRRSRPRTCSRSARRSGRCARRAARGGEQEGTAGSEPQPH